MYHGVYPGSPAKTNPRAKATDAPNRPVDERYVGLSPPVTCARPVDAPPPAPALPRPVTTGPGPIFGGRGDGGCPPSAADAMKLPPITRQCRCYEAYWCKDGSGML